MKAITSQAWEVPIREKPVIKQIAVGEHAQGRATYTLPTLWTLHLFQEPVEVGIGDHLFRLGSQQILLVPPNLTNHYYFPFRPNRYYYAHFALPASTLNGVDAVPAVSDPEHDYPRWKADFLEAIQIFPEDRWRAEIRFWDMLLRLLDGAARPVPTRDMISPALQKAIRLIELRLTEPIAIPALAAGVGISHNHLTRLFQKRFQKTVQAYIRSRRLQQAHHLLRYTTQSVKEIAVEVGIANLQLFNKSIRNEFGCAPRKIRYRGE
ncbi:MAG TPA: hypothetical protein DCS43_15195 [Verrucomicrobia bacterium]|nr:hypothetical protein [Verrucomicrobiota bacterium]